MERAERTAEGGALCVVSARPDDVSGWLARSNPTDLSVLDGRPAIELHPEVRAVLDDLVHLGGHEQLADATSRAAIVRRLRELVAHGHEPPADAVETYAASTGLVNDRGARRIRGIYEAVLVGEPFRIHGHLV